MLTFGDCVKAVMVGLCAGLLTYFVLHGITAVTGAGETCHALVGVSSR